MKLRVNGLSINYSCIKMFLFYFISLNMNTIWNRFRFILTLLFYHISEIQQKAREAKTLFVKIRQVSIKY